MLYLASLFLGEVYAGTARGELAVEAYLRAVEARPDAMTARVALGHRLQAMGRFSESARVLQEGLADDSSSGEPADPWTDYLVGSKRQLDHALTELRALVRR